MLEVLGFPDCPSHRAGSWTQCSRTLARTNMKDGELSLHSNAALAVAFALAALGSACGGVVSNAKPDGGSSSGGPDSGGSPVDGGDRPDAGGGGGGGGGPLQLGGGGPAALVLTCPELAMPTKAGTVFVDAESTGGDGSKAAPFATVAEALASAGDNGVIYVAAGTYRE